MSNKNKKGNRKATLHSAKQDIGTSDRNSLLLKIKRLQKENEELEDSNRNFIYAANLFKKNSKSLAELNDRCIEVNSKLRDRISKYESHWFARAFLMKKN